MKLLKSASEISKVKKIHENDEQSISIHNLYGFGGLTLRNICSNKYFCHEVLKNCEMQII